MRALKSVKKLPRPSIENPRLVKRMKSGVSMKKPTLRVDKILLNSSSSSFKISGDPKEGLEEHGREVMARAKSKSKFNKTTTTSTNTSFIKDKSTAPANLSLNQSTAAPFSWKDSLRDFRKSSRPTKISSRPETPELTVTGPGSARVSRSRKLLAKAQAVTPARSSARLRQAKLSGDLTDGVSGTSQVPAATTPGLNLSVMKEFRFQLPTVVSTERGNARPQPPLPVQSTAATYLTPLARSLRTADTAAVSSNNNLNQSRNQAGDRRGVAIAETEESQTSGRSQSRQRGVLLPLLKEKDQAIRELERKVASLEEEREQVMERNENLLKEKEELSLENLALVKNVKNLENQVVESEERVYQLEKKTVEMYRALEAEQSQVESLHAEVGRLTSDKPSQEEGADPDLNSLVRSFVEKVSVICRNENLKVSHHHENVKLRLATRKCEHGSLENTHLGEQSPSIKCHSISSEMSSRLVEETSEVSKVKASDSGEENRSPVKVKSKKQAEIFEGKLSIDSDVSSGKADPVKTALADKKLELLKVQARVRTRSMSRQGKDPKVK